jgi:uncharacterized protein
LITLDTSALLTLIDRTDPEHRSVVAALTNDPGPYLIPAGILSEVAYLVESRLGAKAMDAVLADIEEGAFTLDCGDADLPRVRELALRYSDLPLGYADAAVVACAERHGGRVLALDKDFNVVAAEKTISVLPT